MVRYNLLALVGAILCIVSIPLFWVWTALFQVVASSNTDLDDDLAVLESAISVVFIVGAVLALRTTLASILLVPTSVTVSILEIWYYFGKYDHIQSLLSHGFLGLSFGLFGSIMVLAGVFVQISPRGRRPLQNETWLTLGFGSKSPGFDSSSLSRLSIRFFHLPTPKRSVKVFVTILVVFAVVLGAVLVAPVSRLSMVIIIDAAYYGPDIRAALYVDGHLVSEELLHGEGLVSWYPKCSLSAGSHVLGIDFADGTTPVLDGVLDLERHFKVLPFTTEYQRVGFKLRVRVVFG